MNCLWLPRKAVIELNIEPGSLECHLDFFFLLSAIFSSLPSCSLAQLTVRGCQAGAIQLKLMELLESLNPIIWISYLMSHRVKTLEI